MAKTAKTKIVQKTKTARSEGNSRVKKVAVKQTGTAKTSPAKSSEKVVAAEVHGLSATVMGVDGKSKGHITLPKELFEAKINKQLMAQAVRVYLANQREGGAATKTRGKVEGSTRKIYRQKGTGRARHGSIRAPIFVGGGIVFGPQPHSFRLAMPEGMRRVALASALTQAYKAGQVAIVDGLSDVSGKTSQMYGVLQALGATGRVLLVTTGDAAIVARAARNIEGVDLVSATSLNTYVVTTHPKVVIMKEAIKPMVDTFVPKS